MGNGSEQVWVLGPPADVMSALWEIGAHIEALVQGEEQLSLSDAERKDVWHNGVRIGSVLSWTYEDVPALEGLEGLFASFASNGLRVGHLLAAQGASVSLTDFVGPQKNVVSDLVAVPGLMHHENAMQRAEAALKAHLAPTLDGIAPAPAFVQAFWGQELHMKKELRQITWSPAEVEAWWTFMEEYLCCFGGSSRPSGDGFQTAAASFYRSGREHEALMLSVLATALPGEHRDLKRLATLTLAKGFNAARFDALKAQASPAQLWSLCDLAFEFASDSLASRSPKDEMSSSILMSLLSVQRLRVMDVAWEHWQSMAWPLVVTIDAPGWKMLHEKEPQWPHWNALLDRAISLGASAPIKDLLVKQRHAALGAAWETPPLVTAPKVRM